MLTGKEKQDLEVGLFVSLLMYIKWHDQHDGVTNFNRILGDFSRLPPFTVAVALWRAIGQGKRCLHLFGLDPAYTSAPPSLFGPELESRLTTQLAIQLVLCQNALGSIEDSEWKTMAHTCLRRIELFGLENPDIISMLRWVERSRGIRALEILPRLNLECMYIDFGQIHVFLKKGSNGGLPRIISGDSIIKKSLPLLDKPGSEPSRLYKSHEVPRY